MTGFACWPGYLGVVGGGGCLPLVDHYRLLTYLRNCPTDHRHFNVVCATCPELAFLEGGIARVIGCPATDPAPWYNPADPAWVLDMAGRFYGPEIIEWKPQPFAYVETSSPRVSQRPRRGKLRIEGKVRLWGEGCDATLYGLEWFQRAIRCQLCDGLGLQFLRSCDPNFDPDDPAATGGDFWRLVNGARILVQPDPNNDDQTCCFYRDASFVIEADDSCSYWVAPSVECVMAAPWLAGGDEDDNPDLCRCGPLCPCEDVPADCVGDCLPDVVSARTALNAVTVGCYCVPFSSCRKICEIPVGSVPGVNDAVLKIDVASPAAATKNLRLWIWKENLTNGPDLDWDRWRCTETCTTIDIGSLEADDVLTIDGRDHTVGVLRDGGVCPLEVTTMGQPLNWPILTCGDAFWVAVEYDTYLTAPDLEVTVGVYPRECWTV